MLTNFGVDESENYIKIENFLRFPIYDRGVVRTSYFSEDERGFGDEVACDGIISHVLNVTWSTYGIVDCYYFVYPWSGRSSFGWTADVLPVLRVHLW
jgi:hypothetical protein